jgi:pilus assembly protein CpaC
MKTLLILISLLFCCPAHAEIIIISLGESKHLALRGAANVWIENKQVVKAEASGGGLILKGLRTGESLIRINGKNQKVQIIHPSQAESFSGLQQAVKNIAGLSVAAVHGSIAVKGKLYSLNDWKKLSTKNLQYQMRADISEKLQDQAQEYFKNLMKKEHLPRINVIFSDAAEMRVNPKSNYIDKYKNMLSPYGIQVMPDPDVLETAPTIKVQITVAEVNTRFRIDYGIAWPSSYKASILGGEKANNDLNLAVNALEHKGYGKVLASPNIVCRSGKEAEFLAGGEIPILMKSYKTQEVIWKKYGVLLKVKPTADSTGRMSISIETEVSSLNKGDKIGDVPGVNTNRVSSHFDLNKPRTIALSGLIKNDTANSRNGLPLLSRLPVLGPLFSSRDFEESKSELVIFVRPSILEDEEDASPSQAHLGDIQWK